MEANVENGEKEMCRIISTTGFSQELPEEDKHCLYRVFFLIILYFVIKVIHV